MERVARSMQWKATGNQLVVKSNTPQGQHMHLRHITCITQKPQVAAALLHKTSSFYQKNALVHSTAHTPNVAFLLFYQDFRRFPFSGSEVKLLARTSSAEAVRLGSLSATARQRSRTRSNMR